MAPPHQCERPSECGRTVQGPGGRAVGVSAGMLVGGPPGWRRGPLSRGPEGMVHTEVQGEGPRS